MSLTLEDFEKRLNAHSLVPMRIKRSFAPYYVGDIAGFPAKTAFAHWQNGDAELTDISVEPPAKEPPQIVTSKSVNKDADDDSGGQNGDDPVEIPENWPELHHLKRLALAKRIAPDHAPEGDEKPLDAADRVIKAELQRRAAEAK